MEGQYKVGAMIGNESNEMIELSSRLLWNSLDKMYPNHHFHPILKENQEMPVNVEHMDLV